MFSLHLSHFCSIIIGTEAVQMNNKKSKQLILKICILFTHPWIPLQDWLCSDPQDMKGLLDEMTEQITHLETKIQVSMQSYRFQFFTFILSYSEANLKCRYLAFYLLPKLWDFTCNLSRFCFLPQLRKEQLDLKMQAMAESDNEEDGAALDETKLQLEEELATLPMLSTELESLRARVNEYNQLAGTTATLQIRSMWKINTFLLQCWPFVMWGRKNKPFLDGKTLKKSTTIMWLLTLKLILYCRTLI